MKKMVNMKKTVSLITLSGIITLMFGSCTKNNDFIKEELEKALPSVEVTSLGLYNQVGPFTPSSVLDATFGGSITNTELTTVDYAWYTGGAAPELVDSVHFERPTVAASKDTNGSGVSTSYIDTTYPNTAAFSGNLILPLSALQPGAAYTLKVYVRNDKGDVSNITTTNFITVQE